jgi:epoxyqueuosine reductase
VIEINSEVIKQKALEIGFHKVGVAAIALSSQTEAADRLNHWLELGYQGEMEWMKNPKRQNIYLTMPEVKSVIAVALNYYTPHQRPEGKEYGKISRYGWGRDYHKIMHKKLKILCNWLESENGGIMTKYYADTGPISDKFWAQQAGLGWIAKNGNLITREYGSWIFLGEVLTNLQLSYDLPHDRHCGSCTRCLEACPTKAITSPYVVDANRCIAYHTIENRAENLPEAIAQNLSGWVAGCDICQDVCPWNQRFSQPTNVREFEPYAENLAPKLIELTEISEAKWNQQFTASALRRIKPQMWRRNAKANLKSWDE